MTRHLSNLTVKVDEFEDIFGHSFDGSDWKSILHLRHRHSIFLTRCGIFFARDEAHFNFDTIRSFFNVNNTSNVRQRVTRRRDTILLDVGGAITNIDVNQFQT